MVTALCEHDETFYAIRSKLDRPDTITLRASNGYDDGCNRFPMLAIASRSTWVAITSAAWTGNVGSGTSPSRPNAPEPICFNASFKAYYQGLPIAWAKPVNRR